MHDQENDKKRSMVNISLIPSGYYSENDTIKREIEVQNLCKVKDNETLDTIYSKLNEKFINEIIDLESERQKVDQSPSEAKC